MNETPQPPHKNHLVLTITAAVLLLLIAFGMWQLNNRVQKLSDQVSPQNKTPETNELAVPETLTATSGKGAFTMTVPIEWGPLTNAMDSDFFILPGKDQPAMTAGKKAGIIESAGYGSDSPSLFVVSLSDEGWADIPLGTSTEFTIGKEDGLVGKKYAYTYPKDTTVGIGYMRHQNDREYRYMFTTKSGKKLDVIYNVYGSDPRNFVDTVDAIVQSIVVK